jgi:hypothetical protein
MAPVVVVALAEPAIAVGAYPTDGLYDDLPVQV